MDEERKICVGKIVAPHGLRGQVKLRSFTEEPDDIFVYRPVTDEKGQVVYDLRPEGLVKDCYIVTIKGVDDRSKAEAVKGLTLWVSRSALPQTKQDEYYNADLIGLVVQGADPRAGGTIASVHDYGAGTFIEVKNSTGSYMLPFTQACVPVVDVAGGFVEVVVPQGWLDKAGPDQDGEEG